MIRGREICDPHAKDRALDEFDPRRSTWVVSDLKSKFELQRRLLARHGALEDAAVLRASDLWRKILWRQHPEIRIVSMDLMRTLVQQEIASRGLSWAKGPGAAYSLTKMMPQFLPLIARPAESELVREWLRDQPDAMLRWGHWFELSDLVWKSMRQREVLPSAWIPALLFSSDRTLEWPRPVVVDLSAHLTVLEIELLRRLAEHADVEVLEPAPPWRGAFPEVERIYRRMNGGSSRPSQAGIEALQFKSAMTLAHFATPLAEVKDAVAQVRIWLDQGIAAERIAIVAPDIEIYWPWLAPALGEEGIPLNKARTQPLHGLGDMQSWLAVVRLELGAMSSEDLELATFRRPQVPIVFERFKRLFSHVYDLDQLNIEPWLKTQFSRPLDAATQLTRDEFIARVAARWPVQDTEPLERLIKQLLEDAPGSMQLPARNWLEWLEAWAARIERTVKPATSGIEVVNLMSSEWLNLECVYVLGVSEEALNSFNNQGLGPADAAALERDLGLLIPPSESASLEFEARWLFEKPLRQGVMSFALTDPFGQPQTPSRLWLANCPEPRQRLARVDAPRVTRWDEIQRSTRQVIAELRQWPLDHIKELLESIEHDLGLAKLPAFFAEKVTRLSATQLEKYAECPFIFAAEAIFGLADYPPLDLDLDPITRGGLIHAVLERLSVEPMRFDYSDEEILAIVDDVWRSKRLPDLGLWPQLREEYRLIARRFLRAESDWRARFPATRTTARELKFSVAWDVESAAAKNEAAKRPSEPTLAGRIDRIDSDGAGEWVVYDYKTGGELPAAKSWNKKGKFQLALYARVLEAGLTELGLGRVRGALYYNLRSWDRLKGLHLEGANRLVPEKGRRGSGYDETEREALLRGIDQAISELYRRMRGGVFAPVPRDQKSCGDCKWRNLCRAPHLH